MSTRISFLCICVFVPTLAVAGESACDKAPEVIKSGPPTVVSTNYAYALAGMRGFLTLPTVSGTAYRSSTFSGEVVHQTMETGVLTDSFTGNIVPGTEYSGTTTTISGARGAKTLNADGTITDTSAFYGSETRINNGVEAKTEYEYKATDAYPASYWNSNAQYSAVSDAVKTKGGTNIPFHKISELYVHAAIHTRVLFDLDGNITSAISTNINTGATSDASGGTDWGPLVRTNFDGISGTSRIELSGAFAVAPALATPTTGVATTISTGQQNQAYAQAPNWQVAQETNGVYFWRWASQSARITSTYGITCPGTYRVVLNYSKSPLSGSGTYGDFSTQEEVIFDDATRATIERDIPVVDPAVGVTENKDKYVFTLGTAEKLCDQRAEGEFVSGLDSVNAGFYLGRSSGWIRLRSESIGSWLIDPNRLEVPFRRGVNEWVESDDGMYIQYKALDALVAIAIAVDWKSYRMEFFRSSQVGAKSAVTRLYSLSGSPYASFVISNPGSAGDGAQRLRIEKVVGENLNAVEYSYLYSQPNGMQTALWTYNNGASIRKLTETWSGLDHTKLSETFDLAGVLVSSTSEKYTRINIPNGTEVLLQEVADPAGTASTTTREYYYDASLSYNTGLASNPGYGLLKQIGRPDGSWERYVYDSSRKVTKTLRPYLNAAPTSDESQCRVSQVIRSSLADADGDGVPEQLETAIEFVQGIEAGRNHTVLWSKPAALGPTVLRKTSRIGCVGAGAAWNDAGNLVTTTYKYAGAPFYGETRLVVNPDGTATGRLLSVDAQGTRTIEASSGRPNTSLTAFLAGRRVVSTVTTSSNAVSEQQYDIATGLSLGGWTAAQFDSSGRPTRINYSDGTFVLRSYACCGLESETDREGIVTSFGYEGGRLAFTARSEIMMRNEYDAAGRQTASYRRGADASEIRLHRDTYTIAGDVIASSDAGNRVTTYARVVDTLGQSIATTTYPDGGTRIDTYARDGSLLSVGGTAAAPKRYEYGSDANGVFVKEIKVGSNGELTEWTKTYRDFAGRSSKIVFADGASAQDVYNAIGQLVKRIDPDGVTTLYAYNSLGETEYTVTDMNGNGQIDFDGTDRIGRSRIEVATSHGVTVQRSTLSVWAVDGPHDVAVTETSADGRQTWQTAHGLTTATQTTLNGSGGRTVTTTAPEGTISERTYANGRLTTSLVRHPALGTMASSSYTYDPHGRMQSAVDARSGATTFSYLSDDQVRTVTTPDPDPTRTGDGYDPQTTTYSYDLNGRRSTVTYADGGVANTSYYPTGQVKRTWGVRAYPVEYSYDSQGRAKTLTTWQDFAADSGKAVTTWNYDPPRGFLRSKTYADNAGPTYTYTAAGRLRTRTSARGVVTTYSYNAAGEISNIVYSDATTPGLTFAYDRLGRLSNVAQVSASNPQLNTACAYGYQGLTSLSISESQTGGVLAGVTLSRTFDSFLRLGGLGTNSVPAVSYLYDPASRLSTVNSGQNTSTYAYHPGTSLFGSVTSANNGTTRLVTTKAYDNLNRLSSINNGLCS